MAIRSFTGFLNSSTPFSENPNTGDTFDPSAVSTLEILMEDGISDLVVEGDSRTGPNSSNNTEDSEDAEGDQFVYARDAAGNVILDGVPFYLESVFVFEINGQQFTGYHFEEDSGGGSIDFSIIPDNLPPGTATIVSVNYTPNPNSVPYSALTSGNETIDDSPYANLNFNGDDQVIAGDGDDIITTRAGSDIIDAGAGNDTINSGSGGDTVDGGAGNDTINAAGGANIVDGGTGDDLITSGNGADVIEGGSGDDTILSGGGNDIVGGGYGNDTINGGAGNDTIRGDSGLPLPAQTSQGLDYSTIPNPDGSGTPITDEADISDGFTLNSGTTQAAFTFFSTGDNNATFEYNNNETQFTGGLNDGGPVSNNALSFGGVGQGDTSQIQIDFSSTDPLVSDEMTDVQFRINDIDDVGWNDVVTIRAFDASGNQITVNLTPGSNMIATDTDGVAGNDTVTAVQSDPTLTFAERNETPADESSSLLVNILGPVSRIEIDYGNNESAGQRIELTEIFYNSNPIDADDVIDGGSGNDTIFGEFGDDQIVGGSGADTIDGGIGDDVLDGGTGTDTVRGGDGDDKIRISAGVDTIEGGAGRDTFTAFETNTSIVDETITVTVDDDGDGTIFKEDDDNTDSVDSVENYIADEAGDENDTITLTDAELTAADVSGIDDSASGTFTAANGGPTIAFGGPGQPTFSEVLAGTTGIPGVGIRGAFSITDGDEAGQVGNISFENFENINFAVVCFARGTMIRTPAGMVPVEDMRVGDHVVTLDNGTRPIRWAGHRLLDAAALSANPNLRPIRIKAGALGNAIPARDLIVSPQHRILVRSKIAIRMFDSDEILVPAKHLVGADGIEVAVDIDQVTYHHIMCDDHEVVEADGALAETLYTGQEALKALSPDARKEIEAIFGDIPYLDRPLARVTPKGRQARQLVARHIKNKQQLYSKDAEFNLVK